MPRFVPEVIPVLAPKPVLAPNPEPFYAAFHYRVTTILLFTMCFRFNLFTLIVSLLTGAILLEIIYFTLLLLEGFSDVRLEEVALDLDLLGGV